MIENRAAGILIECGKKLLILHRKDGEQKWGLPAGGIDFGETDIRAAIREMFEETGFSANPTDLQFVGEFVWKFSGKRLVFSLFKMSIPEIFAVRLDSQEHFEYKWVTPEECYEMEDLIEGLHEVLEKVYFK
jgi:8-oxo-dGTP pyrophosphatase MutT (NUDIX family)